MAAHKAKAKLLNYLFEAGTATAFSHVSARHLLFAHVLRPRFNWELFKGSVKHSIVPTKCFWWKIFSDCLDVPGALVSKQVLVFGSRLLKKPSHGTRALRLLKKRKKFFERATRSIPTDDFMIIKTCPVLTPAARPTALRAFLPQWIPPKSFIHRGQGRVWPQMGEPHLSLLMTFGSHFTVALDLDSRVIGFKETLLIRNTKRLEFEWRNF